ncbi:hypothetical protein GIW26_09845 [Pseudomonas syringae]|nr:hypothetical protein [Pseudomonas syringae]
MAPEKARSLTGYGPGGRGASRTACDAERRTIVAIVPHAPAWECSSRRSASEKGTERRTIVAMIVPHAPRGNAVLDALRRQKDAERRTIVAMIVPHAPRGNAVLDALRRKRARSVAR